MWPTLLGRLLGEDGTGLILSLDNASEISVQQVLAIQEDFVVVRGRWAGSSESGWTFFVPWNRIVCVCFAREVPAAVRDLLPSSTPDSQETIPSAPPSCSTQPVRAQTPPEPTSAMKPAVETTPTAPSDNLPLKQRLQELRQHLRQQLGQKAQPS